MLQHEKNKSPKNSKHDFGLEPAVNVQISTLLHLSLWNNINVIKTHTKQHKCNKTPHLPVIASTNRILVRVYDNVIHPSVGESNQ